MGECDCRQADGARRLGMSAAEARWVAGASFGDLAAEE